MIIYIDFVLQEALTDCPPIACNKDAHAPERGSCRRPVPGPGSSRGKGAWSAEKRARRGALDLASSPRLCGSAPVRGEKVKGLLLIKHVQSAGESVCCRRCSIATASNSVCILRHHWQVPSGGPPPPAAADPDLVRLSIADVELQKRLEAAERRAWLGSVRECLKNWAICLASTLFFPS